MNLQTIRVYRAASIRQFVEEESVAFYPFGWAARCAFTLQSKTRVRIKFRMRLCVLVAKDSCRFLLILLLSVFAHSNAAFASLTKADLNANDQLLTLDSVTDLYWLNLTVTMNSSVSSIESQYTPLGFRFATLEDIAQLYTDAGIPIYHGNTEPSWSSAQVPGVLLLQSLLGVTSSDSSFTLSAGMAQPDSPSSAPRATLYYDKTGNLGADIELFFNTDINAYATNAEFGSVPLATNSISGAYLVRGTAVPEPSSTISILGAGFVLLFGRPRRPCRRAN